MGITTGLPDQAYSFSGGWYSLSKVVLRAAMLRGRHRSLPVAIDKAIVLPGDYLLISEWSALRNRDMAMCSVGYGI